MTVPPEHLKEPPKVAIRRKKLPVQETINRHLPGQNQQVVNSKEIIMATNLPVAGESPHQQVNHIAAGQAPMPGLKEAMDLKLRAREKVMHLKERVAIRTDQIPMTGTGAASAAAKRKVSNQEIHLTQDAQLLAINPGAILTASHPVKRDHIQKELPPIRAGQLLTINRKEILTASHRVKKGPM